MAGPDDFGKTAGGSGIGAIPGATGAPPVNPTPAFDKVAVLGHAIWVLSNSGPHRHLFIADLEWAVMPPVALGQFRLWHEKNVPVAFASWALLSEATEQRVMEGLKLGTGLPKLRPDEWQGGERLWLWDMVAPFGGAEKAFEELKTVVFPGRELRTISDLFTGGPPRTTTM